MSSSIIKRPFKFCMVPYCSNTTLTKPQHIFISVPTDPLIRNKWFQAANCKSQCVSPTAIIYCCGDHFNLPNDIENWIEYRTVPNTSIIIKKDVVPYIFECQTTRGVKRKKTNQETNNIKEETPNNEDNIEQGIKTYILDKFVINADEEDIVDDPLIPNNEDNIEQGIKIYKLDKFVINADDDIVELITPNNEDNIEQTYKLDKFVINTDEDIVDLTNSDEPEEQEIFAEPFPKIEEELIDDCVIYLDDATTSNATPFNQDEIVASSSSKYKNIVDENTRITYFCNSSNKNLKRVATHLNLLKTNSNFYIGIPEKNIFIIELISKELKIHEQDIYLCLKKIRRDLNFILLANDFGTTRTKASNCFHKVVPKLARFFKKFIIWPKSEKILENLPRSFRKKYQKLESIVDCLEITIPEPQDGFAKSQCWSSRRNKYIFRYLISSTPDGLVNFVSGGFGGSKTDNLLMEISGYLDCVPVGRDVMINQGFCKTFQPPVIKGRVSDKLSIKCRKEMQHSVIVKMCVAGVMKRFRDFLITIPFDCIHSELVPLMDDIIVIIAGLMNLQHSSFENEVISVNKY